MTKSPRLGIVGLLFFGALLPLLLAGTAQGYTDRQIRDFFSYDRSEPLDAEETLIYEDLLIKQYEVYFTGAEGRRVRGLLTLPKSILFPNKRYPVILYLHGYGGSNEVDPFLADLLWFIMLFRPQKYAMFSIDARYHGEDERPNRDIFSTNFLQDRNGLARSIIDNRRAIDYLQTHNRIIHNEIHLIGISMGAVMGSMVTGVDNRVRAASLIVGGGDWTTMVSESDLPPAEPMREALRGHYEIVPKVMDIVDPVNVVHLAEGRFIQMHNGIYDTTVPTGQLLFDAAREPKEIFWYDANHYTIILYSFTIIDRALDLFDSE